MPASRSRPMPGLLGFAIVRGPAGSCAEADSHRPGAREHDRHPGSVPQFRAGGSCPACGNAGAACALQSPPPHAASRDARARWHSDALACCRAFVRPCMQRRSHSHPIEAEVLGIPWLRCASFVVRVKLRPRRASASSWKAWAAPRRSPLQHHGMLASLEIAPVGLIASQPHASYLPAASRPSAHQQRSTVGLARTSIKV